MPRNIRWDESVKENTLCLVEALLVHADDEFNDEELKTVVYVEWVTEKKLLVTGKKVKQTNGKRSRTDEVGTKKEHLLKLVAKAGKSLKLPQRQKKSGSSQQERQLVEVQYVIDVLRELGLLEEDDNNTKKNQGYWKFTLTLEHQTKREENLELVKQKWKEHPKTNSPETSQTGQTTDQSVDKNLEKFKPEWELHQPENSKQQEKEFVSTATSQSVRNAPFRIGSFQAPPLPDYFVDRPEVSQDLKTRLLAGSSSKFNTLVISAIHGLGAIGKSTLAAALAHDSEVQKHFYDGILWATLGQEPDVLGLLGGWVQALRDYNFRATNVEATSTHLCSLLYDKAVLLVVDDAWNTADAQPFKVGGSRCQMLVTTRDALIAEGLGASSYRLDVMQPEQAMELLTKKVGRDLQSTERESAITVAKAVGYLPLARELAATQVANGTPWEVLLQDIQGEVARLKTFDRPGAREITDEASLKRLSLTASLNLSIQRLPEVERENFIWLGVLPEDVTITQAMTATLWEMDERDAADTLEYLRSKALLLSGVPLASGTLTYRLHDLWHDLTRNLLTAPATPKRRGDLSGLGLTLATAHATFLERYQGKTQNGLWHTLPQDGYIQEHLVWHLEKAGQVEEIHQLLREEVETGKNAWYEVRERLGQIGGYLSDIARAWELAEATWTEANLSKVVGLQCRYALMATSVHSIAQVLSRGLLVALVKKNVWTPESGLTYALQIPYLPERVQSLTALADYLPLTLKWQALQALQADLAAVMVIPNDTDRSYALENLADKLPDNLLPQALQATMAIRDGTRRTSVLITLADKLPTELLPQVLETTMAIRDGTERASVLMILTKRLPEVLPQALSATVAFEDEFERALVLICLSKKLPDNLLPQALEVAKTIQNKYACVIALSALSNKENLFLQAFIAAVSIDNDSKHRFHILVVLADKLPAKLLPQAFQIAMEIQDESARVDVLTVLADKLPDNLLPQALTAAQAFEDAWKRMVVLKALADKLPEALPQALEAAKAIQDEASRARALKILVNKLPDNLLPEALEAARAIQNEVARAWALGSLADRLPSVLPEALKAFLTCPHQYDVKLLESLDSLADKLPAELLPQALSVRRVIRDTEMLAYALSALADQLPEALPQALSVAMTIEKERYRAYVLRDLADKLPDDLLPQVFTAAMAIQDESDRSLALTALADKLPEAMSHALCAAMAIQDESSRSCALRDLASKLPADLLPQALCAAMAIADASDRADALNALADKLPEALPQALCAAMAIASTYSRACALEALADKLPDDLLPQALSAATAIEDESDRARALEALADKLPAELLPQALCAAIAIEDASDRVKALISLSNQLPEVLPQALSTATAIEDASDRVKALISLSNQLPEVLPQTLSTAIAIEDKSVRGEALAALADKVPVELLPQVLTTPVAVQTEVDRARAVVERALADNTLSKDLLLQAIETARAIQDLSTRAKVLIVFVPILSQMPPTQLFPIWQDILHSLSFDTRSSLLDSLRRDTVPVIFALGGEAAVAEVVGAIVDVGRWWH